MWSVWYWQRYNHMTHTPCLILQSHSEPQTQSGCLIIHTSYIKCCSHTSCLILQLHPELQSQFSLHWNHLIIAHTQHWWHTTQVLGRWMATKSIIHNWQSLAIHYRYGQQHIPGLHREICGQQMMIFTPDKSICLFVGWLQALLHGTVIRNECSYEHLFSR